MTTNQQRAAEVILPWIEREYGHPEDNAESAVQALVDAGLITPDLPEPETVDRFPGSKCWQLAPYRSPLPSTHVALRIAPDGSVKVNLSGEIDSPQQLREIAAAALAAAAHATQEKK